MYRTKPQMATKPTVNNIADPEVSDSIRFALSSEPESDSARTFCQPQAKMAMLADAHTTEPIQAFLRMTFRHSSHLD